MNALTRLGKYSITPINLELFWIANAAGPLARNSFWWTYILSIVFNFHNFPIYPPITIDVPFSTLISRVLLLDFAELMHVRVRYRGFHRFIHLASSPLPVMNCHIYTRDCINELDGLCGVFLTDPINSADCLFLRACQPLGVNDNDMSWGSQCKAYIQDSGGSH